MILKSMLSLCTTSSSRPSRSTVLAVLAFAFLATGGSLKAQNCPASYYTVTPPQYVFSNGGGDGLVQVYAPPYCTWTLFGETYSGPFAQNFSFGNLFGNCSKANSTVAQGAGNCLLYYHMNPNGTRGVVQGNVHIESYPDKKQQIVERVYPN